ncbi:MAG: hypothetical protein RIE73_29350 [Coleofasciculus sp. C1-SOL-03]|uniref:hypothetical protein n=1 Tax=Coleofasciculus sp. C1-SOL-03 TaxID=3069522 RepID=UPI0032FA8A76
MESWAYIVFVHRRDKGGQFISYRRLRQWFNAIACQIQHCTTCQQLQQLWLAIERDRKRHNKQYNDQDAALLYNFWTRCWHTLSSRTKVNGRLA